MYIINASNSLQLIKGSVQVLVQAQKVVIQDEDVEKVGPRKWDELHTVYLETNFL